MKDFIEHYSFKCNCFGSVYKAQKLAGLAA